MPDSMTPMDLDLWILYATEALSWESTGRVRAEVTARFAEACQAACAAGRPEAEAQAEALRGLGDPHAANRRFRKTRLSEADLKRIKSYYQYRVTPKLWRGDIFGCVLGSILGAVVVYYFQNYEVIWFLMFFINNCILGLLAAIRKKLLTNILFDPQRGAVERRLKRVMLAFYGAIVSSLVLALAALLVYVRLNHSRSADIYTILAIIVLITILGGLFLAREYTIFIPLLRKMRQQEASNETPEWERHA